MNSEEEIDTIIPKEVWENLERQYWIEKSGEVALMNANINEAKNIINDKGRSNKREGHDRTS